MKIENTTLLSFTWNMTDDGRMMSLPSDLGLELAMAVDEQAEYVGYSYIRIDGTKCDKHVYPWCRVNVK